MTLVLTGTQLMLECENLKRYSEWEHKSTPSYANGPICVMGDAAHASTPWQGSGAALAMEDAVVLAAVLGQVESRADVAAAFQGYSQTRMKRAQRVIDSSRKTGRIMCLQDEARGKTPEEILEMMKPRWDFIRDIDIGAECRDAVRAAEQSKAGV